MQIELYHYSAIGDRPVNEDSLACGLIDPQNAFAAVCDGLGGHGGGRDASQIAATALTWDKPVLPTE